MPFDLILFDDETARAWEPFALTRPVGELLLGTVTMRERAERVFGGSCIGHLGAAHLDGFDEPGAAPVIALDSVAADHDRLFLLSRFVPAWPRADDAQPHGFVEGPICAASGEVVAWFSPAGAPNPPETFFLQPDAHAPGEAGQRTKRRKSDPPAGPNDPDQPQLAGTLLENVWDLIARNPDQITTDIGALHGRSNPATLPSGAYAWGDHPVITLEGASIEPGAVFDTTRGPILLDRGAHVHAFTRLAGPAYVGAGSMVLGGAVEAVSIGPVCRVRGELAESVCLGYVNKQHDGHIGHAYLGRWVNLGAETTNSDLKNNYGTIRMWTPAGDVDTGEIKLGSLIGDHVKTGIGLLLNTGSVIGAGSNLYGAAMPPAYVPPFSWGSGTDLVEYRLDRFLEVAERAMARRGVELSQSMRAQLEQAWERGRRRGG